MDTIEKYHVDDFPSRQSAVPAVVERTDPVVYSQWQEGAALARNQAEFFDESGYLHELGVFTPEEVGELQSGLRDVLDNVDRFDPHEVITEGSSNAVRSVFRVHATHPLFARLAVDARLVRIAQFLLGDDVYVHQSRINFKPGFGGREFYWHSDFETWHVEDGMPRMRAVSASISLFDTTDFNGPLMVIPGSHRSYVSCVGETPENHYKKSLKIQKYGVPDEASMMKLVERGGIISATGPAGAATIFDCNVMHGSNGNITPWPRSNVFIVYNACSNAVTAPFGNRTPRPEFLSTRQDISPLVAQTGNFA